MGVYAKGPVILIHLLPVALSMPMWAEAERPPARQWAGGLALAVALVAVGLWLVPALILGGPEYRTEVLWRQSGGRVVTSFAHRKPWWLYAALLPAMIWPFSWTGAGLGALRPRQLWADPGTWLAAVWAMGAFLRLRLRARVTALAALPLALMIGLHLGLSPLLSACYDMTDLGRAVTPHDAAGIAVTDGTYHVQLNFSGRLLNPVARLSDDAVAGWLRDHPGGVLLDQTDPPP